MRFHQYVMLLCRDQKFSRLQKLTLNAILCRFDSMVQKFGQQLKKIYSKVYGNLIYIKIFPFA